MRHITLKKSTYRDSVSLMRISKLASGLEGVTFVMVAIFYAFAGRSRQ